MTRKQLVPAMAEELGLPQLQIKQIVQKTLDAMVSTHSRGGGPGGASQLRRIRGPLAEA